MSLKYIAGRLGVSTATVSNVLNGKGRVSQDVERKIRSLIRSEKLDIKRRRKKRTVETKRYIALAMAENQFFWDNRILHEQLLIGIKSVLEPQGYSLLFPFAAITPQNIRDLTRDVDALLLVGFDSEPEQYSAAVSCPLAWLFRTHCDSADCIHDDHDEIGRLAAQFLFTRGHCTVGFIDDPRVESLTKKGFFFMHYMSRLGGKVVTVTGNVFNDTKKEDNALNENKLRALLGKLLSKRNNVTALFIPGNRLYANVSLILWEMGRRNENAVEVFPCISVPPLIGGIHGYIDINLEEIGRRATQCIFWRLDNPNDKPIRIVVRPKLVPGLKMA